jgi:hypothetical protein
MDGSDLAQGRVRSPVAFVLKNGCQNRYRNNDHDQQTPEPEMPPSGRRRRYFGGVHAHSLG